MADQVIDVRNFRAALSSFATGVTIVTASDEQGNPVGMTASSFNSVSMDPPLVLWSVTKTAHSAPIFQQASHFAVHILAVDQTELSNKFARSGEDKFSDTAYELDEHKVPILSHCVSRFDCQTWQVYEGGDHWIIVGKVLALEHKPKQGLVFASGSYSSATPLTPKLTNTTANSGVSNIDSMLMYQVSRSYHQLLAEFHTLVNQSGLTVPQWRILASIEGEGVRRTLPELSERTFVEMDALEDVLYEMEQQNWCQLDDENGDKMVRITSSGNEKVTNLLAVARDVELHALQGISADDGQKLSLLLQQVIENSN